MNEDDLTGVRAFHQKGLAYFNASKRHLANCWYCGVAFDEENRPAKSHSVQQSTLKQLADSQNNTYSVLSGLALARADPYEKISVFPVSSAGVFESICLNCENSLFASYENSNLQTVGQAEARSIILKISLSSKWRLFKEFLMSVGCNMHLLQVQEVNAAEMEKLTGIHREVFMQEVRQKVSEEQERRAQEFRLQFKHFTSVMDDVREQITVRVVCNVALPSPAKLGGQGLLSYATPVKGKDQAFVNHYFYYFAPDLIDPTLIRFIALTLDSTPKVFDEKFSSLTVAQWFFFVASGETQLFFHPETSPEMKRLLIDLASSEFAEELNTDYELPMIPAIPKIPLSEYSLSSAEELFLSTTVSA